VLVAGRPGSSLRHARIRPRGLRRPTWLRATGFSHWAYALKKRLPPGKYVIYSRATGANGLSESNFTAADKNRVQFTVK